MRGVEPALPAVEYEALIVPMCILEYSAALRAQPSFMPKRSVPYNYGKMSRFLFASSQESSVGRSGYRRLVGGFTKFKAMATSRRKGWSALI